jgi:hypothetical protein
MILQAPREQVDAILGAMAAVAMADGPGAVTPADRLTVAAAGRVLFGLREDVALEGLRPLAPRELAGALDGEEAAGTAGRVLAVMALVDGVLDAAKVDLVRDYAAALGLHEDYVGVLTEAAHGELAAANACMLRKNIRSFPMLDHAEGRDVLEVFLPYRAEGAADPELAARYAALGELSAGTFGRAFFDHFRGNGFAFPGDPAGLAEGFTTPHDSSHVIAGYSTSQAGEICVSTFIGAMHPDHPMAAEVIPVLFSWHLGIKITDVAGSFRCAYEPRRFWTAWDRGAATSADLLDPAWDFWGAVAVPLDELRSAYAVPPLDRALAA